jgi:hypothetical protein
MTLSAKLRRAPTRLVAGAFILNTGLDKLTSDDDETAKAIHSTASNAYPVFEKLEPKMFLRILGAGEVTLGAALLLPVVPAGVAGLGLAAFSGGLLRLYWRTPGMHHDGNPRPTQHGTVVAKDSWMFGIGTALVIDALTSKAHDKRVEATHHLKEARAAAAAKAEAAAQATKSVAAAKAAEATSAAKRTLQRVGR